AGLESLRRGRAFRKITNRFGSAPPSLYLLTTAWLERLTPTNLGRDVAAQSGRLPHMNAMTRRVVVATAAVSALALGVSACGKAGSGSSSSSSSAASGGASAGGQTIGLLLPENQTTRYEKFDKPYIEAKIKSLDPSANILYD